MNIFSNTLLVVHYLCVCMEKRKENEYPKLRTLVHFQKSSGYTFITLYYRLTLFM